MHLSKRAEAFTLIELLIVVAIIGILAAIAVPNFLNIHDSSNGLSSQGDIIFLGGGIPDDVREFFE